MDANNDFQCYCCMEHKPRNAGKSFQNRQPKICHSCHDIAMKHGHGITMILLNLADDVTEYLDDNRPNPLPIPGMN